jgi:hypothetical protein
MRAISDTGTTDVSLRVRIAMDSREVTSDLESLKSGKDRTKPWCALKIHETATDFHRALSRLPNFSRNSPSRFRDGYSWTFALATRLLFADLITFVAAGL